MTVDPEDVASRWARELPRDFSRKLAAAMRIGGGAVQALRADAVLPGSAAAVRTATALCADGDGPFVAGLLLGRLSSMVEQPRITPVWTGPESSAAPGRLTLPVITDLIAEATEEIVLVSYATIPSQEIQQALIRAASRGVAITLLLERPEDKERFNGSHDPFPGLVAQRLHWPAASRPTGASMHAKILVIDRTTALVGSANFTGHGLERNLECGLLLRGGPVPAQLVEHLMAAQALMAVF